MVRLHLLFVLILCLIASALMVIHMLFCTIAGSKRGFVIGFGIDQAANGALGGDADETLCSRAWRNHDSSMRWRYLMYLFNWIFSPVEDDHCHQVYKRELQARIKWNKSATKG